jgi:hypothetical protein
MRDHAFHIGQFVDYTAPRFIGAALGPYEIIRQMPSENGELKYRIRSPNEPHERVAKESDLSVAGVSSKGERGTVRERRP